MNLKTAVRLAACAAIAIQPGAAFAQSVNLTRSILPSQPYTIIYPEPMIAIGGGPQPLTINHPEAPLQCELTVVPVDDTQWTAENALAALDDSAVTASWIDSFPGFVLGTKTTAQYQDATALLYDGTSTDSPQGLPLTIVHTETVSSGNGYALDCLFSTAETAQARPVVDFIIANFSTRPDADCCIGVDVEPPELLPTP